MELAERFINYTKFDTQSNEESESVPSTAKQLDFARYLKKELENEGLSDVEMDEMGYIYATLKGNTKKKVPTIGFISHYDTSPDASGKDVKARIIRNYDGNDITLSPGKVSTVAKFPELKAHVGEDIIVTDGTTLLGADDKAGIAEIVQAMCFLRDPFTIKNASITVEGKKYGTIVDFAELNLIGCAITQPAGAAFDKEVHAVAIDGSPVKSKVVITKDATGIAMPTLNSAAKQGVYSLGGVKLNGEVNNLPKGFYVINGKKVVKK